MNKKYFFVTIIFIAANFFNCDKLKKINTKRLQAPSTSDWTDATALNPIIDMLNKRNRGVNCIASGVKLPFASCADSGILPPNGCISGYLAAGTIKYYRYLAGSDENLSMAIADSTPASFTNCVATYKENSLVGTNTPVTEFETNQSLTSCQPNTTTTIKSGSYRCLSVHSFCDSYYKLKIANAPSFSQVTSTGNATLTLPSFSNSTTTYIPIDGIGTPITGDNTYWSIPIGFSFSFFGQTFTNLYASSNGLVSFNGNSPDNFDSSNLFVYKDAMPSSVIAPWWTDFNMDCASDIQYITSGTNGNRVLTVQWRSMQLRTYDAYGSDNINRRLNFQVKLYETTNIIEFVYGPATGNTNSDELAAIGIKNTVNGKIVFINGMLGSSTNSTRYKNISFPASGTVYRFTP
jgi:hypothetical protein